MSEPRRINGHMTNVLSKRNNIDHMTNEKKPIKSRAALLKKTEYIADKLVELFNAPESRKFFLLCAWRLSENDIWTIAEASQAEGIEKKVNYFVASCNRLIKRR